MTTYAWPTDPRLIPQRADLQSHINARHNASPETGATQAVTRVGSKWGWSIEMPAMRPDAQQRMEAWVQRLSGYEHRAQVHDWKRPRPRGTCNLSGVTVSGAIAQFATTGTLSGCGAGKTLLAGDWLQFGSGGQLVMVAADATADGSGSMSIEFRWAARAAISNGTAVVLDKPTALYVLADPNISIPRAPGFAQPGFALDLIEVFA